MYEIQLQWLIPYLNKSYVKLGHRNEYYLSKIMQNHALCEISFFLAPWPFSWALRGPCCVHPRHPVLHFEWVNVPGHVVINDKPSSPPLCWSCGLIINMHIPNFYETGWINLLDVESSPSKFWPVSIYQVCITSVCYVYQKIVILMILHTNFWWFRTLILKCLMILHMNIA